MSELFKLIAPNGKEIIGTSALVPGTAHIEGAYRKSDGGLEVGWSGYTEMDWDNQVTETDPDTGELLFVDEDGGIWLESALKLSEETAVL